MQSLRQVHSVVLACVAIGCDYDRPVSVLAYYLKAALVRKPRGCIRHAFLAECHNRRFAGMSCSHPTLDVNRIIGRERCSCLNHWEARMQAHRTTIEKKTDPRVVRSPGRSLEDMLLEQERELSSRFDSAHETAVRRHVRSYLRNAAPTSARDRST